MIHGVEAKLSEKTHSHDIDYSEEERRLIEEQSQRLESWKRSPTGILHTMKELQGPPQSGRLMVNITKPTGLAIGETVVSSQPQDGTRKLQIVFPSLKEPTEQEDTVVKDFGAQETDRDCFKNLNKEELELLHSLMKKLDFHQLQNDATAGGGASSDETISAHTTSSLPPSDTEGTLSTASEPTAQAASPIQTAPETQPSESQSAESSATSPDVDPSLQPTSEGASREETVMDTDVSATTEKPGEERTMEHQHNNLDGEGAGFTPGMMAAHNPMAAMATMGHFMPPAAAAGFMPPMLPTPMNPYMMVPQNIYYYQLLQQAHYNQIMQQSMAAASLNSPTMLSGNQEEGSFFQQKDIMNPSLQDAHVQAMDPVEVTANTNHTDNEQLRGNSPLQVQDDFTSNPSGFPVSSVNLHFDRATQGINMAPSSFTGTTPIVANSLPLSAEDTMSATNNQLQFATDEHQAVNPTKDLFKVLPPKVVPVVPSQLEPVSTNSNKTTHMPQREPSRSYASHHNTANTMAGGIKTNHTTMCKQPQSNKQDNNNKPSSSIQQRSHHSKYDVRSIDHDLSQMGMHNSFPNGIPSMVFSSSEKRRKTQQT